MYSADGLSTARAVGVCDRALARGLGFIDAASGLWSALQIRFRQSPLRLITKIPAFVTAGLTCILPPHLGRDLRHRFRPLSSHPKFARRPDSAAGAGAQSLSGRRGAAGQRPARSSPDLRRVDRAPDGDVRSRCGCRLVGRQSRHRRHAQREEPVVGTVAAVDHCGDPAHLYGVRAPGPRAHDHARRGRGRRQRPVRRAHARGPQRRAPAGPGTRDDVDGHADLPCARCRLCRLRATGRSDLCRRRAPPDPGNHRRLRRRVRRSRGQSAAGSVPMS